MPKTCNAFALKDFDEKKILSRPFFKDFELPEGDDDDVIKFFDVSVLDSAAVMEQRFDNLRKLDERLKDYRRLIKKHRQRLRKLFSEYDMADDEQSKSKLERTAKLLRQYGWFEESVELFNLKFGKLFADGDKAIQIKCREEFADNLQRIRTERKMTQRELAARIGISPPSLSQYEHASIEPTIKNLLRLAKILGVSVDALLRKAPK